jgi:XTP/dITP diphosphohydrolase
MTRLCFATNNLHKIKEMNSLLGSSFLLVSLQEIGCHEELPETQQTIAGNAIQKAQYVFDHFGIPCFADDTGLEVEALDGAPGVDSAFYAGPQKNSDDNVNLLLSNLRDATDRRAQFRTVIALIDSQGIHTFEGIAKGTILRERRGGQGFGYDPVFVPEGFSQTFAEMSLEEKNKLSHRGKAVAKLVSFLQEKPKA